LPVLVRRPSEPRVQTPSGRQKRAERKKTRYLVAPLPTEVAQGVRPRASGRRIPRQGRSQATGDVFLSCLFRSEYRGSGNQVSGPSAFASIMQM
jgi:hypothetical protein